MMSLLVAALVLAAPSRAGAERVDVVIQAGHQGRPASCERFRVKACNLGASDGRRREVAWTPIVADAAAAELRRHGLRVRRLPADYAGTYDARAAMFIHFDGSTPCASGASVGYPARVDEAFARRWEQAYRAVFPFRFVGENITTNESQYYGFRRVHAAGKSLLVELGEITCPAQANWLEPRLPLLGRFLATFVRRELGR